MEDRGGTGMVYMCINISVTMTMCGVSHGQRSTSAASFSLMGQSCDHLQSSMVVMSYTHVSNISHRAGGLGR